ncbi:MAG: TldD/PmbA family protein [Vicinamibacteria bacterium]|jgi:PmbA protein|nr:TldD/PmbA family protein [Vicinamibacteria bacterium]
MSKASPELYEVAQLAVDLALKKGASAAAARAAKSRDVEVRWRDGKVEQVQESTTRGVSLALYVDGRYAAVSSSDLRRDALETFIADSVVMTRSLAPDPHRALPDPALYAGRREMDLQIEDPAYLTVSAEKRRTLSKEMEDAARAVKGAEAILSVSSGFNDNRTESVRIASNGFSGDRVETTFFIGAEVAVKDADGRRPSDSSFAGVRYVGELPSAAEHGRIAAERALSRLGAKKVASKSMTMVLDNRVAGRLVGALGGPLSGQALQQKRSFLEGKLGQAIGSKLLHVSDDPFVPKGFGSRLFDGEGLAAKQRPVFEDGVLRTYFIDTYYGRKLNMAPTTGGMSNLAWRLGERSREELIRAAGEGIYVTGFLGGNSNATTGDYSLGVQGFVIRGGALGQPVAEMNISGNQLELWKHLVAVGDDPYPYSTLRTPTLVFDAISFAGL